MAEELWENEPHSEESYKNYMDPEKKVIPKEVFRKADGYAEK